MDAIPPTRAALVQHIKRTVYQGGHCCARCGTKPLWLQTRYAGRLKGKKAALKCTGRV